MLKYLKKSSISKSLLVLFGLIIIGYSIYIYQIASDFTYAAKPSSENILFYSVIRILVGVIYTLAVILVIKKYKLFLNNIVLIFLVGLISRLILVPTEPILEDDFNRYLWDGAVTANGYNPYQYPPNLFFESDSIPKFGPEKLYALADSSNGIIDLVNHPHIRTIYPPLAQGVFSLAYFIDPWSVSVWKILLLLLDIAVFFLLIYILKQLKNPGVSVIIYWWNPILIHEIFNSGHMDLIMYPFILIGIIFLIKDKIVASTSFFALAVGGKIWPIIFLPFVLKRKIHDKKVFLFALFSGIVIIFIILFPILITKLDNSLGFITYTKNWTNNEAVFQIINLLIKEFVKLFEINYHCSLCLARWIVVIFFAVLIIYFLREKSDDHESLISKFFFLVAIMYLISPTQFPWYYTWVLPLLVLKPRLSFVAYAILLPLYQLKYSKPYLIWIEHIPILILFITELVNEKFGRYLTIKSECDEV